MKEKEEAEEKNGKNVKQQSEAKIRSKNLKQKFRRTLGLLDL